MGQPLRNDASFLQTGLALSGTAQQSFPMPSSGTFAIPTTVGRIRIKIYNGGGTSPTVADVLILASDGTNSVVVGQGLVHPNAAVAITTTQWYEEEFEYILDTAASGAGGGASGQLSSVVGGANSFSVKTTLGGTSPTASMDMEICPLI
jgi:hypothetical protein